MSLCGDNELSQVFCGMKEFKTSTNRAVFFFIVLVASSAYAATPKQKAEKRLQDAGEVLQQIMNAPDKGIPIEVVQDAKCIAVIPMSYSRSKGIFAGVTLNGAWVSPDEDSMVAFYGENATCRDVLLGKVPSPLRILRMRRPPSYGRSNRPCGIPWGKVRWNFTIQ
jgi:lipid-binding SYLF domain-containing protein